ncbi:MAG: Bug family tripartite tricarboxylate transporter substrate binding protein [Xanthobacteraceae bacterium]
MILKRLIYLGAAIALSALAFGAPPSQAQTWPHRSVKFILPLGPGSGVDISARLFADRLTGRWGQPVVVENRPGGDGIVAITAFISAGDDHTLLYAPASSFTAHPFLHDKLPYDHRDLVPIARVSNTIVVAAVPPSLNVASVKQLMELAKAKPGTLNFNTATGVTDFIFDGYFKATGLSVTRVPYRDTVQALNDLGEGRIQLWVGALAIARPHVQAGRVKLIAITNSQRPAGGPDVPTVTEAGYPELTFDGLTGLFGPREMAPALRERVAADLRTAAADPEIVSRLTAIGQVVSPGSGAEFAASIDAQRNAVANFAKTLGTKPSQ